MIKNLKKLQMKKTTIYLSLGLHKGRPSYQRSLQLSKENSQHFKTWNFLILTVSTFVGHLPSWIRIRNTRHQVCLWCAGHQKLQRAAVAAQNQCSAAHPQRLPGELSDSAVARWRVVVFTAPLRASSDRTRREIFERHLQFRHGRH